MFRFVATLTIIPSIALAFDVLETIMPDDIIQLARENCSNPNEVLIVDICHAALNRTYGDKDAPSSHEEQLVFHGLEIFSNCLESSECPAVITYKYLLDGSLYAFSEFAENKECFEEIDFDVVNSCIEKYTEAKDMTLTVNRREAVLCVTADLEKFKKCTPENIFEIKMGVAALTDARIGYENRVNERFDGTKFNLSAKL